jgi:hypothetical protein
MLAYALVLTGVVVATVAASIAGAYGLAHALGWVTVGLGASIVAWILLDAGRRRGP